MATNKDVVEKKLTFRKFQDGVHTYDNLGKQIFQQDKSHKCPTYVHRTPPCQGSCPSGEDIRGWLDIVSCLVYTSPSPRDRQNYRMPSSA